MAVGVGNYVQSELELIATDPIKHVLTTTDFGKLVTLVKELRKQTCESRSIYKKYYYYLVIWRNYVL